MIMEQHNQYKVEQTVHNQSINYKKKKRKENNEKQTPTNSSYSITMQN